MKINRRHMMGLMAGAVVLGGVEAVHAQDYPTKAIRVVVGTPPGGNPDIVARMMADEISKILGQPVVVENKPGASGNIASTEVSQAAPDGYTVLWGNIQQLGINPNLYKDLPFDAAKAFSGVARVVSHPLVIATNVSRVPAKTLAELVEQAKAAPGSLSYSSPGAGSANHVAAELFKERAGIDVAHIPYKGSAPSVIDLVGGQVDYTVESVALLGEHIKAGTVRGLAIMRDTRSDVIPDVPTIAEAGYPGLNVVAWQGVAVPAGTPKEAIDKLDHAISETLKLESIQAKLKERGISVDYATAADFDTFMNEERARWKDVIEKSKITID